MEVETDAEYFDYLAGLSKSASASRLCWSGICFAPTKLREKSKKGTSVPFLVVLRGIAKAGLPREPSEAVRAGKGGTTKRTRPAACGGARDVEFVPTQIPLCHSFFQPSTALSSSCEKESGVETSAPLARFPRALRARIERHPSEDEPAFFGRGSPSACGNR